MSARLPDPIRRSLEAMGFAMAGAPGAVEALAGGVASDIWRVATARGPVCVKAARARLKVEQRWEVPVERNAYEVAWLETAAAICPGAVPRVLGHDPAAGFFVMDYLDPRDHPVWKEQLRDGRAEPATARAVGRALVAIHAATAGEAAVAARFPTDALFHALRPEPYLIATAARHPDLAGPLERLAASTLAVKKALIHGDVSPKNILVGRAGPVFLDAECACYGDPAFDLAFCLNHLLLKCLWNRPASPRFLACFDALAGTYLGAVDWEPAGALEARAAALLPGLLLGRVDGKSPVEYLRGEAERERVRAVARPLLARPVERLAAVREAWAAALRVA